MSKVISERVESKSMDFDYILRFEDGSALQVFSLGGWRDSELAHDVLKVIVKYVEEDQSGDCCMPPRRDHYKREYKLEQYMVEIDGGGRDFYRSIVADPWNYGVSGLVQQVGRGENTIAFRTLKAIGLGLNATSRTVDADGNYISKRVARW
jgi:hypothetical protein